MKIRIERLDGDATKEQIEARRFPFKLGQAKDCHHRIDAKGVWPHHLTLEDAGEKGIVANHQPEATLLVNGATVAKSVRLQNGDVIELGAAKLRFWLAPLGQAGQRKVEFAIWATLGILTLGQVGLIAWLLRAV
ncbi:MAG TPA: hypothetical protein DGJ56_07750 [Verrucomicrobiales bacterium]|nr:hypothetical protein [Verrucomicrobiales bacterium]